jgi:hypothetical protein
MIPAFDDVIAEFESGNIDSTLFHDHKCFDNSTVMFIPLR